MTRRVLDESKIHPQIRDKVATHHSDIVSEVEQALQKHDVVVVGMKQNPHPRRARKMLDDKGVRYEYLEYGTYFGPWRRRTALKMWSGWPTFPMVFVKGTLIGGANELKELIASGELQKMLAGSAERVTAKGTA